MAARGATARYRVLTVVALGLAVAVSMTAWARSRGGSAGSEIPVVYGHPAYAFDPRNDGLLAANATDIFVGRVTGVSGNVGAPTSVPGQTVPQTQYGVEVRVAIKGGAAGTVTVNQIGGYDATLGATFLFEGDQFLAMGDTLLLVTAFVPDRGWYQIVAAGYGHLRANDTKQRTGLIERFARAAGVEVPKEREGTPRPDRPESTKGAATETPTATATVAETPTEIPTEAPSTVEPVATETPALPTETPIPPTEAPATDTPVPPPSETPLPTATEVPPPTEPPVEAAATLETT